MSLYPAGVSETDIDRAYDGPAAPTLFDPDALEHGHRAAELAASRADADWRYHAEWLIRTMPEGREFLAEEIAQGCAAGGFRTEDARALGGVILAARRDGLIEATGRFARAATSNGQPKAVWRRLP